MALLFEDEYTKLGEAGIAFEEDAEQRFLIFKGVRLPEGVYTVPTCDALVVVPPNYPQAGNDMFWTSPRLNRADGRQIPATSEVGQDSRICKGTKYCRWSRHWDPSSPGAWRAGKDDVMSIFRRVYWALKYPDGR